MTPKRKKVFITNQNCKHIKYRNSIRRKFAQQENIVFVFDTSNVNKMEKQNEKMILFTENSDILKKGIKFIRTQTYCQKPKHIFF